MWLSRLIGRFLPGWGLPVRYAEQTLRLRQVNMIGLRYGMLMCAEREH